MSEISFAFPQVMVGSILEYRFTSNMKHYGGLEDWEFQSHLPVYRSSYSLVPAPNLEFTYSVQKREDFTLKMDHNKSSSHIFFEMTNLPGLDEEPFMDAREDYVQKVCFQLTGFSSGSGSKRNYMNSWKEVARDFNTDPDYGGQLKSNLKEAKASLASATAGKTDKEKMEIVLTYVRSKFSWNGYKGRYPHPDVKGLWNKKSGNAAAINLALVNLLREVGLDANPMLVSERGNGRINTSTPFLREFNTSYATVTINGRQYFLNGADNTPAHLTPNSILNTTAVVIRPRSADVTQIAEDSLRYTTHLNLVTVLDEEGNLRGSMHSSSKDYARAEILGAYTSNPREYTDKFLRKGWANVEVDSFKLNNQDNMYEPLIQDCKYQTHAQETGDYFFLPLNLFSDYHSNPFLSKKRFSNVNLGYKTSFSLNHSIALPANYTVDAVPKSMKLMSEDRAVTFVREIFYTPGSNQIVARMKINIDKSLFDVSEYSSLKEFYGKMIELMNEQVVLKKK